MNEKYFRAGVKSSKPIVLDSKTAIGYADGSSDSVAVARFFKRYGPISPTDDFQLLVSFSHIQDVLEDCRVSEIYDTRFGRRWVNFASDRLVGELVGEAFDRYQMCEPGISHPPENWDDADRRCLVMDFVNYWLEWIYMFHASDPVAVKVVKELKA